MFVFKTAWKDLLRRLRDPLGLLVWLCIPIAIGGMIRLAFGGGGGRAPRAHVLVVDQDHSVPSRLLVGALAQERTSKLPFEAEAVGLAEGRERIENGDGSALLVVPEGFAEALLREEPCVLELVTNPAQRILPGMVEESLELLVDVVFYLHRVFGEPLRAMAIEPPVGRTTPESAEVARIATDVNERMERVAALLAPPVIQLQIETEGDADSGPGFGQLFFPSMLFMTLFFLAQGLSEDVWIERQGGTLRRVLVTPHRPGAFLAGKALAAVALVAAVSAAGLCLGRVAFQIPMQDVPLAVLWASAAGLVVVLALYLLQMLAQSQRGGGLLVTLVVMPLLMLGGSFFPFEAMPAGLAAIGRRTPNGYALERLKAILAGSSEPSALILALAGALLASGVLFVLCAARLRRFAR